MNAVMKEALTSEYQIFITCLAAYNNGTLHGEWVDIDRDIDDIQEDIDRILESSPEEDAEEFFITDYELPFKIGEYESIEDILEKLEPIKEHGEAYAAYMDWIGEDYATPEHFEEAYCGEWSSEMEFHLRIYRRHGAASGYSRAFGRIFRLPSLCQRFVYR